MPELDEFRERIDALRRRSPCSSHLDANDELLFGAMSLAEVQELIDDDVGYYFLMAATGLNRTELRRAVQSEDLQVVSKASRRAQAARNLLPPSRPFDEVARKAVAERRQHLDRRNRGGVEQFFRERLVEEGIPLAMSPPRRVVAGALIRGRKPDGVYPDPATGLAPTVYLEIKNIRRPRDDIQKRLYELAQASLEMKAVYGDLSLRGFAADRMLNDESTVQARAHMRRAILATKPTVVGLFICSREDAARYRDGAEAFVDRLFFTEEVDECISFLRRATDD